MRPEAMRSHHSPTTPSGILALALFCTGCASIWTHADPDPDRAGVYPGARQDARLLAHPEEIDPAGLKVVAYPFILVDTPLSAAVDTVLLPLDLTRPKTNAPPQTKQ